MYQCLKARYFPHYSFLEVVDSSNSLYIWKSIMVAQPVIQKGSCWRVGDGSSIHILQDKWIPNHPSNKVLFYPIEEQ